MAIADGMGGGGIRPYLSVGSRRAPWEDELDKLLLGLPQAEWGAIRASLGLSPGGGYANGGTYAPGGGIGAGSGGGAAAPAATAMAAPATFSVGNVPAGSPNGAGEGGAGGMGEFGGYGQSSSFSDWAGNLAAAAGLITGPLGAALVGGRIAGTMIADPNRPTLNLLADNSADGNLTGGMSLSDAETAFGDAVNSSQPLGGADRAAAHDPQMAAALADMGLSMGGPQSMGQSEAEAAAAGAQAGAPGSDGFGGNSQAWRHGGPVPADGDGALEPVQGTVHEGEFVLRPEAVAVLGLPLLEMLNALGGPAKS